MITTELADAYGKEVAFNHETFGHSVLDNFYNIEKHNVGKRPSLIAFMLHTRDIVSGRGKYEDFYRLVVTFDKIIDSKEPYVSRQKTETMRVILHKVIETCVCMHGYGSWKDVKYLLNLLRDMYELFLRSRNVATTRWLDRPPSLPTLPIRSSMKLTVPVVLIVHQRKFVNHEGLFQKQPSMFVPLQFWYCRNPGLALPLIALQYHEVKINLDLRPIDECLWAVKTTDPTESPLAANSNGHKSTESYQSSLVAASLYVDYLCVYLYSNSKHRHPP